MKKELIFVFDTDTKTFTVKGHHKVYCTESLYDVLNVGSNKIGLSYSCDLCDLYHNGCEGIFDVTMFNETQLDYLLTNLGTKNATDNSKTGV